jgi:putative chitinase
MAPRTVYGNTISENGWPMVDQGSCQWVTVPGCNVSLQIQVGQPVQILRAFAADINAYVQPLRDADSACWTEGNSVDTSNHLSGTAIDVDWNDHPMGPEYAGWTPAQIAKIRELLDFYEGTVFWGEDWDTPKDSMHFQMGYNTFQNDHTQDFINRKIRADGFSTFGRGDQVSNAAQILADATGLGLDKANEILPTMQQGLQLAQCNNDNRIAMFIAQTQEESANYDTTEEYASGAEYEGRGDLGNTVPGDGVRYKGRTWIQVTGRHNYGLFSQWAFDNGLVPTASYFVDNPTELSDMKWAGVGAAWYWTVARPDINSLCDAGDVVTVTQRINGGTNGLDVRTANWNRARAQGDALLALLTGGDDFLMALTDQEQHEVLDLLRQQAAYRRESRSRLRWPHQGEVDTCAGFAWSAEAWGHESQTEKLAVEYGDPVAIANLYAVATTDEDGRDGDKVLAAKILEKCDPIALNKANTQILAWLDAEGKAQAAA